MKEQKIEFKLDEKVGGGEYANIVNILFNDIEFIFDFARILPGTPVAKINSRIIMNPKNVKILTKALEQRVADYEKQFGEIQIKGIKGKGNIGFKVDENS